MPVNVIGHADAAGLRDAFQPRRDIHAVAQDVVAIDQHVTQIDADAKQHAYLLRHIPVALSHEILDYDGAIDGGNNRRELQEHTVPGRLDDSATVVGHDRIARGGMLGQRPRCTGFIKTHEPAVAGDVRRQNGRKPSLNAIRSQVATSWLLKRTIAPSAFDRYGRSTLAAGAASRRSGEMPAPEPLFVVAALRRSPLRVPTGPAAL